MLAALALLAGALAAGIARGEDGSFECVVLPHSVLDLSSGVSGRLDLVHVDRAERITAGQPLAELESRVERATLKLASARAGMRSEVGLREARLEYDTRHHDRLENLAVNRVASVQEVDDAARDAELAAWQVRVAKDNLILAALEADRAAASLELRTVLSPFDGVVVERFKSPGEYVDEEPILRVARLDPLRVEVIIPIDQHPRFHPGLDVRVYPETHPDAPWIARVTAVDAVGDPASGTFRARLELPNPDGRLLAGIKCMASLDADPAAGNVDGVVASEALHDGQLAGTAIHDEVVANEPAQDCTVAGARLHDDVAASEPLNVDAAVNVGDALSESANAADAASESATAGDAVSEPLNDGDAVSAQVNDSDAVSAPPDTGGAADAPLPATATATGDSEPPVTLEPGTIPVFDPAAGSGSPG